MAMEYPRTSHRGLELGNHWPIIGEFSGTPCLSTRYIYEMAFSNNHDHFMWVCPKMEAKNGEHESNEVLSPVSSVTAVAILVQGLNH